MVVPPQPFTQSSASISSWQVVSSLWYTAIINYPLRFQSYLLSVVQYRTTCTCSLISFSTWTAREYLYTEFQHSKAKNVQKWGEEQCGFTKNLPSPTLNIVLESQSLSPCLIQNYISHRTKPFLLASYFKKYHSYHIHRLSYCIISKGLSHELSSSYIFSLQQYYRVILIKK